MRVTSEIMDAYQHVVDELTLVPGGGGQFDVDVERDGSTTRIFAKQEVGRHAQEGEVLAALEPLVPAGTRRYGT